MKQKKMNNKNKYFPSPIPIREEIDRLNDKSIRNIFDSTIFPVYQSPPFNTYLKASSLFNKSVLYENELIIVYLENNKITDTVTHLQLSFVPKVENLILSYSLLSKESDHLTFSPLYLNQFSLDKEFKADLYFNKISKSTFPVLELEIGFEHEVFCLKIPIPLTINKFAICRKLDHDHIVSYLDRVFLIES